MEASSTPGSGLAIAMWLSLDQPIRPKRCSSPCDEALKVQFSTTNTLIRLATASVPSVVVIDDDDATAALTNGPPAVTTFPPATVTTVLTRLHHATIDSHDDPSEEGGGDDDAGRALRTTSGATNITRRRCDGGSCGSVANEGSPPEVLTITPTARKRRLLDQGGV